MKESALGTKRKCLTCSAAFFDLQHDPILCPRCSAVFTPIPIPRSIPYKQRPRFPVTQASTDEPQSVLEKASEAEPDDEASEDEKPERIGDDPDESEPEEEPDEILPSEV